MDKKFAKLIETLAPKLVELMAMEPTAVWKYSDDVTVEGHLSILDR